MTNTRIYKINSTRYKNLIEYKNFMKVFIPVWNEYMKKIYPHFIILLTPPKYLEDIIFWMGVERSSYNAERKEYEEFLVTIRPVFYKLTRVLGTPTKSDLFGLE